MPRCLAPAELLVGPRRASQPNSSLSLVEDKQCVVVLAQPLHRLEEFPAHVIVALTLNRLGDEAGDVVRMVAECRLGLAQRALFTRHHLPQMLTEREGDRWHLDAGPVELGKAVGLHRVGVGARERVPAAPMERAGQMEHPGSQLRPRRPGCQS